VWSIKMETLESGGQERGCPTCSHLRGSSGSQLWRAVRRSPEVRLSADNARRGSASLTLTEVRFSRYANARRGSVSQCR